MEIRERLGITGLVRARAVTCRHLREDNLREQQSAAPRLLIQRARDVKRSYLYSDGSAERECQIIYLDRVMLPRAA